MANGYAATITTVWGDTTAVLAQLALAFFAIRKPVQLANVCLYKCVFVCVMHVNLLERRGLKVKKKWANCGNSLALQRCVTF